MLIKGEYRDYFPKSDLLEGFIGDKVALCLDLVSFSPPSFILVICLLHRTNIFSAASYAT